MDGQGHSTRTCDVKGNELVLSQSKYCEAINRTSQGRGKHHSTRSARMRLIGSSKHLRSANI